MNTGGVTANNNLGVASPYKKNTVVENARAALGLSSGEGGSRLGQHAPVYKYQGLGGIGSNLGGGIGGNIVTNTTASVNSNPYVPNYQPNS
jgi:hypothetical protein